MRESGTEPWWYIWWGLVRQVKLSPTLNKKKMQVPKISLGLSRWSQCPEGWIWITLILWCLSKAPDQRGGGQAKEARVPLVVHGQIYEVSWRAIWAWCSHAMWDTRAVNTPVLFLMAPQTWSKWFTSVRQAWAQWPSWPLLKWGYGGFQALGAWAVVWLVKRPSLASGIKATTKTSDSRVRGPFSRHLVWL